MDLCNSLESSGLSESSGINLYNQKMCTSCDENLVGAYKCQEYDILCQKCYKAHSRLKITKIHVVTPWLVKYTMVDYKHSISVLRLVCGPNFFGTKPAPKFGLVLR